MNDIKILSIRKNLLANPLEILGMINSYFSGDNLLDISVNDMHEVEWITVTTDSYVNIMIDLCIDDELELLKLKDSYFLLQPFLGVERVYCDEWNFLNLLPFRLKYDSEKGVFYFDMKLKLYLVNVRNSNFDVFDCFHVGYNEGHVITELKSELGSDISINYIKCIDNVNGYRITVDKINE